MNKHIKTKGFTILELIFAITIGSVLVGVAILLINVFAKTSESGRNEAVAQNEIRVTIDTISNVTKQASAMFIMPEDTLRKEFSKEWNYIGVEKKDGKSRIVHYFYDKDADKHMERILCEDSKDVTYKLLFSKKPGALEKLLEFEIITYRDGKEIARVNSKSEALNSLQLLDTNGELGLGTEDGQVLAYSNRDRDAAESLDAIANVVLIVESSSIMGVSINKGEDISLRTIFVLYNAATALINKLNESPNVNIAVVVFSDFVSEGKRNPDNLERTVELNKFYPLNENVDKFLLLFNTAVLKSWNMEGTHTTKDIWPQIGDIGFANVADGLRVGHILLKEQSAKIKSETNRKVVDYMILATGGAPNMCFVVSDGNVYTGDELFIKEGSKTESMEDIRLDITDTGYGAHDTKFYEDAAKFFLNRFAEDGIKSYSFGMTDPNYTYELKYLKGLEGTVFDKAYDIDSLQKGYDAFRKVGQEIIDDLWHIDGPLNTGE